MTISARNRPLHACRIHTRRENRRKRSEIRQVWRETAKFSRESSRTQSCRTHASRQNRKKQHKTSTCRNKTSLLARKSADSETKRGPHPPKLPLAKHQIVDFL
ncbi:hypothetical protein [Bacillus marinisedimentorum]|uniref:hypothetical protein n=1 Tax=Bacillus marinisedimentorum TaxID=1821260 RepID=UPI000872AAAC|nr:hypothetical protein [Bacillus marinisedimentorum]